MSGGGLLGALLGIAIFATVVGTVFGKAGKSIWNFGLDTVPKVRVAPFAIVKVPVTVIFLEAVDTRVQFPFTVRLSNVRLGTAVILPVCAPIITSSPFTGAPLGLQFAAVVHTPPFVGSQVFVTACANDPVNNNSTATISTLRLPLSFSL